MSKSHWTSNFLLALAGAVTLALGAVGLAPALAMDSAPTKKPKPHVDCTKKANKTKPECQTGAVDSGKLSDDELYNAA